MTLVLALKLLLAPGLVVASSLAGRRWGPRAAGMLIVLPVVAGPILLIVYLEHGAAFAGRAAAAATLGVVPLALMQWYSHWPGEDSAGRCRSWSVGCR